MSNRAPLVDQLFEEFCTYAPRVLHTPIRNLACTLRLAPHPGVAWSQVFNHEVTLAAPWLVAEAMPSVGPEHIRSATLAHFLAVVEAFGTDRVEDGQVDRTPELGAVLDELRAARDRALERVVRSAKSHVTYLRAEALTHDAIRRERAVLAAGSPTSLDAYERISAGKQAVGIPACLALAEAADWPVRRITILSRMLLSIWLGLQAHDDVADWRDDAKNGGAWAVALAYPTTPWSDGDALQHIVHESGILARLLRLSRRHFRAAAKRASALGALRLAAWCREREREVDALGTLEAHHPGYVVRSRALAALRTEVLQ